MMNEWLPVDPVQFAGGKERKLGGTNVHAVLSPYDIPNAVRLSLEDPANQCGFEFLYSGEREGTEVVFLKDGVSLVKGKDSGRLHKVWVVTHSAVGGCGTAEVELIDKGLASAISSTTDWRNSFNLDVARKILASNMPSLLSEDEELLEG